MRRALPWVLAALGTALVVAGLVVVLSAGAEPVTLYTGSYAPLRPEGTGAYESTLTLSADGPVVVTRGRLAGAGLAGAGLLVLTGLGGWVLGCRTARGRAA